MLRVNLRAFVRDSFPPARLVDAMMLTARTVRTDSAAFLRSWREIGMLVDCGALPFRADRYRAFDDSVRNAGYPAVHHSAAYTAAYRPAYRVLSRKAFVAVFRR